MNKLPILAFFLLFALSHAQDFLPKENLGMNLPQCFADISSLKTELQSFLAQGNISMASMLAEYEKLKPIFSSLKTDCLFGLGSSSLLTVNWVLCISDFAALAPTIAQFVDDIIKKNLPGCIGDLTKMLGQINPIIKDCFQAQ